MKDYAICLTVLRLDTVDLDFAQKLVSENYDVYVCPDEISTVDTIGSVQILNIHESESKDAGFWGSMSYPICCDRATARDKALYWFIQKNTSYKYVWFIEDDVLLPQPNVLKFIDTKYPNIDMLSEAFRPNLYDNGEDDFEQWETHKGYCPLPWARSMVCAVRASHKLLQNIGTWAVGQRGKLCFCEILFPTCCLQTGCTSFAPPQLKTIIWRHEWNDSDIRSNPNNIFHPVKDLEKQRHFRSLIRWN